MSKSNKFAVVARAGLEELGGGPVRSGTLVKFLKDKGLVENQGEHDYSYHAVLKACKDGLEFDTSKRGYIGLHSSAKNGSDPVETAGQDFVAPAVFGNEDASEEF